MLKLACLGVEKNILLLLTFFYLIGHFNLFIWVYSKLFFFQGYFFENIGDVHALFMHTPKNRLFTKNQDVFGKWKLYYFGDAQESYGMR